MKKKIEWWLVDGDGKDLYYTSRRSEARDEKKWYDDNIFFVDNTTYPITIKRKEWLLVDERVVR